MLFNISYLVLPLLLSTNPAFQTKDLADPEFYLPQVVMVIEKVSSTTAGRPALVDDRLPDHVRDFRLRIQSYRKREIVHIYDDPDAPPSAPPRLEHWQAEKRPIGHGGQGRVFLHTCTSGSRHHSQRAVKVIALLDRGGRRRYIRELEIIIKFSHEKYSKYFVKALGWYQTKESLCIAMEYFPLGDLQTYIVDHGALREDEAGQITSQVLQGLTLMHGQGIAHRDVKPKNVLIQQCPQAGTEPGSWWVKISDFGLSKRLGTVTSGKSTLIATPLYTAPEVLRRGPEEEAVAYPPVDMWALGVMAFFMLTNSEPFPDIYYMLDYTRNPQTLFPGLLLDAAHVSPDVQALIRGLMQPKPDERLDSSTAIQDSWLRVWYPDTPILDKDHIQISSPSASSSEIDSEDDRGMTTEASHITGLSYRFAKRSHSSTPKPKIPAEPSLKEDGSYEDEERAFFEAWHISWTEDESRRQILQASQMTSSQTVRLLSGTSVDEATPDENGCTPMHRASAHGDVETVSMLLNAGCDASIPNTQGDTPMHLASQNGHMEVIEHLLKTSDVLEHQNKFRATPLHLAARNGHTAIVELLLENGANVAAQTHQGGTALHLASLDGHFDVVQLLLQKGANAATQDHRGETALHMASAHGHFEVVKLLLQKGVNVAAETFQGQTALHSASFNGHFEVVRLLFEAGGSVTAPDNSLQTPLHLATRQGHVEVIKLLVENGACVAALTESGETPIFEAARKGNIEATRCLLSHDADATVVSVSGNTPLLEASHHRDIDLVKLLLRHGADVAAANSHGTTPLIAASQSGEIEIVQLLLRYGAAVGVANTTGETPLFFAVNEGHKALVELLIKIGADVMTANSEGYTPLMSASYFGEVDIVELLLRHGADVGAANTAGETPLFFAVLQGHVELVELLMKHGANVRLRNRFGFIPLIYATFLNHTKIVKLLLEKGADATEANEDGYTPLLAAVTAKNIDVVRILLQNGADVTVHTPNKNGLTPLDAASNSGNEAISQLLLQHMAGAPAMRKHEGSTRSFLASLRRRQAEIAGFFKRPT